MMYDSLGFNWMKYQYSLRLGRKCVLKKKSHRRDRGEYDKTKITISSCLNLHLRVYRVYSQTDHIVRETGVSRGFLWGVALYCVSTQRAMFTRPEIQNDGQRRKYLLRMWNDNIRTQEMNEMDLTFCFQRSIRIFLPIIRKKMSWSRFVAFILRIILEMERLRWYLFFPLCAGWIFVRNGIRPHE